MLTLPRIGGGAVHLQVIGVYQPSFGERGRVYVLAEPPAGTGTDAGAQGAATADPS